MALESWQYGDPERVAIRKQEEALRKAKACGQCAHKVSLDWNGETYHGCEYKRRRYGVRCELYSENPKKETP